MSEIRIGEPVPGEPVQPRPEGEQEQDPPNILLLLRALRLHLRDIDEATAFSVEQTDRNGALLRAVARYLKSQGEED